MDAADRVQEAADSTKQQMKYKLRCFKEKNVLPQFRKAEKLWWAAQVDKHQLFDFGSWTALDLAGRGAEPRVIRAWCKLKLQNSLAYPVVPCRACGSRPELAEHIQWKCAKTQKPL